MAKCVLCKKKVGLGNGPFFQVPNDKEKVIVWSRLCRMQLVARNLICSDHFSREDIAFTGKKAKLLPKAIPLCATSFNCIPEEGNIVKSGVCVQSEMGFDPLNSQPGYITDSGFCNLPACKMSSQNIFTNCETQTELASFLKDGESQTEYSAVESDLKLEISNLKKEIRNIQQSNKSLSNALDEANVVLNNFKKIFTEGQMRKMIIPGNFPILKHGHILTTRTVCDLLKLTSGSDASITFKLTDEHISVKGIARQKVKLAAQLFSNTTASAIRRCYSLGFEVYNPIETADFIQLMNDWFDVMNSTITNFGYPGKEPFGKALSNQLNVLSRVNDFMSKPIIPNRNVLEHFQKGILMTNRALVMLFEYLRSNSVVEYILTNRLNQDVLEHFFGAIRSKGGLNDHPSPKEFKYRLRKYILARNTECLPVTGNVAGETVEWLNLDESFPYSQTAQLLVTQQVDMSLFDTSFSNLAADDEASHEMEMDVIHELNTSHSEDCGILHEDALEYISGYIIKKLKLEECRSTDSSLTWVDQVSKGFLNKPTAQFLGGIKCLEKIFYKINGSDISYRKKLKNHLVDMSTKVELPEIVKRLFFKCRIFFRIRNLNKRLRVKKAKQRIMGYKKFIKINL